MLEFELELELELEDPLIEGKYIIACMRLLTYQTAQKRMIPN
jgi:hypothetical protein